MINVTEINNYTDLYGQQQLNEIFENMAGEVGQIPFDINKPYVDLNKIAEILGLSVIETDLAVDGFFKSEGKEIQLNRNVSEGRKRFTLAHEMAHSIRNSDQTDLQFRKSGSYAPNEIKNEHAANGLAAKLLMPNKELLIYLMKESLTSIGADYRSFDAFEQDRALADVAEKLKVSSLSLKFRLQNLRILVS